MSFSAVRLPTAFVSNNGQEMAGVLSITVNSNNFLGADRFTVRATCPVLSDPIWNTVPILTEVQLGLNGNWQTLISGNVDSLEVDTLRGELVLHGRDLTSLFIAATLSESFENETSSMIVERLAAKHGLMVQATATPEPVGRYYQSSHTRNALSQHARATTEWDLLTWLADVEGYDIWIAGSTLFFEPVPKSVPAIALPAAACLSLRLTKSLDLLGGISIAVDSWDSTVCKTIRGSASDGNSGSAAITLTATRPNLSLDAANKTAQKTLAQLSTFAVELECEMPGDLTTMPRDQVAISGTKCGMDGIYSVVEVERHFSIDRGFTQHLLARSLPWTVSSI